MLAPLEVSIKQKGLAHRMRGLRFWIADVAEVLTMKRLTLKYGSLPSLLFERGKQRRECAYFKVGVLAISFAQELEQIKTGPIGPVVIL